MACGGDLRISWFSALTRSRIQGLCLEVTGNQGSFFGVLRPRIRNNGFQMYKCKGYLLVAEISR